MRVAINTFYTHSYQPLADIVLPNLNAYANRHGYDLHVNKIPDGNFHFIKTKDCRKLLDEYDLVWTVELDVLVTNHNFKIEDFADGEHDFFVCKDVNNYNGGSFITEASKYGKEWIDFINDRENFYGDEQNVMEDFCNIYDIKVLPHPSINSIPYEFYAPSYGYINWESIQPPPTLPTHEQGNWQVGDFVCHLPGKSLEERIRIFNQIKDKIVL